MHGDLKSRLKKLQYDSGVNDHVFLWLTPGKTADQMVAEWQREHPSPRDQKKPLSVFSWADPI